MFTRYDLTKNFPNGDRYVGEATESNVKEGRGTYRWADGSSYTGEWKRDVRHGRGVWKQLSPIVDRVPACGFEYDGQFTKGMRHGEGVCKYHDGSSYEGSWVDDQWHGMGRWTGGPLDTIASYEGPFHCSKQQTSQPTPPQAASGGGGSCSVGVARYRSGNTYTGEWNHGVPHGKGCLEVGPSASTDISSYEGQFVDGNPHGVGRIVYRNGDVFEGHQLQLKPHGIGLLTCKTETYAGNFVDGLRDGEGTLTFAPPPATSGFKGTYHGQWRQHLRHGFGTLRQSWLLHPNSNSTSASPPPMPLAATMASSSVYVASYSGMWADDVMHAPNETSSVVYSDGSKYAGPMEHGKRCGLGREEDGTLRLKRPPPSLASQHLSSPCIADREQDDVALSVTYEGDFLDDRRHGSGRAVMVVRMPSFASDNETAGTHPNQSPMRLHTLGWSFYTDQRKWEFHGAWVNGVPFGRGRLQWPYSGCSYDGYVCSGLPDTTSSSSSQLQEPHDAVTAGGPGGSTLSTTSSVSGVFRWPDGSEYIGPFSNGVREGFSGRMVYHNRDVYDGAWLADKRHGLGRFYCESTSDTYTGEWQQDKRWGRGVEVVFGVHTYDGSFENDQRHGHGVLRRLDLSETYQGEFADGLYHGQGILEVQDSGVLHEGAFRRGNVHGLARTTFRNGNMYYGQYVDGGSSGEGSLSYANGDRYEGGFTADWVRHGKGTQYFAGGGALSCEWCHGVLHGDGVHVSASTGERRSRRYVDGNLVPERMEATSPAEVFKHSPGRPSSDEAHGGPQVAEVITACTAAVYTATPPTTAETAGTVDVEQEQITTQPTSLLEQLAQLNARGSAQTRSARPPPEAHRSVSIMTAAETYEFRIRQSTSAVASLNEHINALANAADATSKRKKSLLEANRLREVQNLLKMLQQR